jgi:hypothetical protein
MKKYCKKIIKKILRKYADVCESFINPLSKTFSGEISEGWSIVIITDGKNNILLDKLINSAQKEFIGSSYEIIIVGPNKTILEENLVKEKNIRKILYRDIYIPSVPGWITRKKNIGINATKYNKVIVCHDYILFNSGWKNGYDTFGDFEICSNIIVDLDRERSTDWITYDYPNIGQALLPYDKECTPYQYICGIYFVAKRDFLIANPQLENLRWGEAEDIEWSKIIRTKTTFKINTSSSVQFSKPKWKLSKEIQEASIKLKNFL